MLQHTVHKMLQYKKELNVWELETKGCDNQDCYVQGYKNYNVTQMRDKIIKDCILQGAS
jgi:hypothetical protein